MEEHNHPSSLLYIHPSESLAISLVSPLLESNNYHAWSKSMYTALSAKNKIQFIDGTATPPQKEVDSYHAWIGCNNMVVSWLVHSVSPDIRRSILCISELQNEVVSLKKGERSVMEYFTRLRVIWDEIDNFRPEPTCSCEVRCSCNLTSTISQRKHEDHVLQFLRELNEQYSNIQSHVLLMDPMPSISKIFSYVVQQEIQVMSNNFLNGLEIKHVAVVVIVTCSYCGKNGHNELVCFKKHGFPSNKNITVKKICSHCGKTGQTIEVCYKKHGFPPGHKFHNSKSLMSTSQNIRNDDNDQEVRLTQQQYQALMALMKSPNNPGVPSTNQISSVISDSTNTGKSIFTLFSHEGKDILSWILDFGAIDHVVSSLTNLYSYENITPITINLPNGMKTTATHKGIVKISEKLFLEDVLFIPDFCYNLISISKLVAHNHLCIIFTDNTCFIQDLSTNNKIGSIELHGGLYIFSGPIELHERKHQHLLNVIRALLFHSKISTQFCTYALNYATLLINIMPTPFLNNSLPYDKLYNNAFDISRLRVFGCLCYVSTIHANRKKLDPCAKSSIFLGLHPTTKGYITYDLDTHDIKVSRNVFLENEFPVITSPLVYDPSASISLSTNPFMYNDDNAHTIVPTETNHQTHIEDENNSPRRSTRVRKPPAYLRDFQISSYGTTQIKYLISNALSFDNISTTYTAFIFSLDNTADPQNYKEVVQHDHWQHAMKEDIMALEQNNTWTITTLPPKKKGHRVKMVKLTSVRFVLSLASAKNWHIRQLHVNNAFLHGDLSEEVYMQIPPGVPTTGKNQVCLLHKSLYGLKQASRQWNNITIMLVYIDDIIITGNNIYDIDNITDLLNDSFRIKNLGNLSYFLGSEVVRSSAGILLTQRKYALDLLKETGMLDAAPVSTL
ncbi:uncharacterized protein LOC108339119 [Vigna angularis]|uniref:uncharacterized protein LOC108339119 n=1 Tax=Phaseolus angularis TaxID=3914 RepID=UPI000809FF06|nr:uncharacterized protein LOC108339119 [Vigna angularis]